MYYFSKTNWMTGTVLVLTKAFNESCYFDYIENMVKDCLQETQFSVKKNITRRF